MVDWIHVVWEKDRCQHLINKVTNLDFTKAGRRE
jgi:hypothetical protein